MVRASAVWCAFPPTCKDLPQIHTGHNPLTARIRARVAMRCHPGSVPRPNDHWGRISARFCPRCGGRLNCRHKVLQGSAALYGIAIKFVYFEKNRLCILLFSPQHIIQSPDVGAPLRRISQAVPIDFYHYIKPRYASIFSPSSVRRAYSRFNLYTLSLLLYEFIIEGKAHCQRFSNE